MNNQTYTEYACPVVGCEYTDQNVDSLISHEAEQELGYRIDRKWMCLDYLEEALPEDHPNHDAEAVA